MQVTASAHVSSDPDYAEFENLIANRVASATGPLFTTNAAGLWEAYLGGIPEGQRQFYNCRSCRKFIERYGGLVTISESGNHGSPIWNGSPPHFFLDSVAALAALCRAKITGVFINGDKAWGVPQTGTWTHLHGTPPTVFASPLLTAAQKSAEKLQDYITLRKGLAEIPLDAVVQAVRVLEADSVDRSEKTLGVARWLLALHESIAALRGPSRDNLIWLAVAKAPPGWCHIRSTMISTLLDDIIQGLPYESIRRRWNEKMHPLQYQRPTAPPKAGNIEQANQVFAKLQAEGSLARRFCRLDEVTALWRPSTPEPAPLRQGGAFDHLKAKSAIKEVALPPQKIAWDKFRADVLPNAIGVEVDVPAYGAFYGLVTSVCAEAPPLLQWDGLLGEMNKYGLPTPLPRNPVSWYFYHGGSSANKWGLVTGWTPVDAICLKPCYWQRPDLFAQQGPGVFFVLSQARDLKHQAGGGFFPETLRSEYHGIRSVMEAHARQAPIAGKEEGNANGIALGDRPLNIRIKTGDGTRTYVLSLA
jgi:hypothetical protein